MVRINKVVAVVLVVLYMAHQSILAKEHILLLLVLVVMLVPLQVTQIQEQKVMILHLVD